ncbi:transposable element Tc3 transposase [Trichonephila clavipes]|uniref:Transposable element Tc3 transposase n=1 Tax=Trichonephila clavipes TaxID=2585209 RepID=A0A8X6RR85_TRICX|nr:transposable element Tc3 transposase [Trichonephila clavipes]
MATSTNKTAAFGVKLIHKCHNVTVNGDRYRARITNFFIPELNNHDVQELWFQQDGATCHTARATIDLLKDTLGDRLISRFGPVNWPPRSCDLIPLDYFLWGYGKSLVYVDKPQTLDHLEDNISRVIADIRPQMLEKSSKIGRPDWTTSEPAVAGHLLDPYQQPITLPSSNKPCEFLSKTLTWLNSWKEKDCTTGTLTKETLLTFIHTTYALLEKAKYCINELKFQYFLPGKIQTDALESRFVKHRALSGSQYLISIQQLCEVEAKLRTQNFLPVTWVSNSYGQLKLKDINLEDSCNENHLESSASHNYNITLSEKDFRDAQPYLPALTYLAGVCARAAFNKLKFNFCSKSLVLSKTFELNSN